MTLTTLQIALLLEHTGLGPLRNWRCLETTGDANSYLINGDILLDANDQEPRNGMLRKEVAVYQQLAQTDVPVPRILALDFSQRIVPYDVVFYERIEGRNGLEVWATLDPNAQEHISYAMGHILGTIHNQHYQRYGGYDERSRSFGTTDNWRSYLLDKGADSLITLWQCEGLPVALLYGAEDYFMRATIAARPTPALVHGDFGLHNVVLARSGDSWRISGVSNFAWALAGDAEYEFATGFLIEPDEVNPLATPFLHGYRSIRPLSNGWQQRSAVYRLIYHMTLCATVWKTFGGDPAMLRYHRGMIVDILKAGLA